LSHACCACDWTAEVVHPDALRADPCWTLLERALLQHTHNMRQEKLHHAADKNMCEYQPSVLHGAAVASPCQHINGFNLPSTPGSPSMHH